MDPECLKMARRGWIPLEGETEQAFVERARHLEKLGSPLREHAPEALELCQALYGISPDWVPCTLSSKGLSPWQGAATWLEETPEGFQMPSIQVTTRCAKRLYSQHEFVAHELVHAVRVPLKSPRFEEFFAYRTSSRSWRRWLGPLFRTPREAALALAVVPLSWPAFWIPESSFLLAMPLLLFALALARLSLDHRYFNRCLTKLESITQRPSQALQVMLHLNDREILAFAQSTPSKIKADILEKCAQSLRWRIISTLFFEQ